MTLVNGVATSVPITTLSVGNHAVTAAFTSSNGVFTASQGTLTGGQSVTQVVTKTALAASIASPSYGQSLTFTATVTLTGGGYAAAGTVQFKIDGAMFGTPVPVVHGKATSVSTATLRAARIPSRRPTRAIRTSRPAPPRIPCRSPRRSLTVTANSTTKAYQAAVPALSYTLSGFVNGETASVVTGAPRLTTTASAASPVGNYPITVSLGTLSAVNYDFPKLVNGVLTVQATTTTTVTSSKNPSTSGAAVTFTARVAATPATVKPAGTVQFLIDGVAFGRPVALVNGVATSAAISTLSPGSHVITAVYTSTSTLVRPSQGTLAGNQTVKATSGAVLAGATAMDVPSGPVPAAGASGWLCASRGDPVCSAPNLVLS